MARCSSDTSRPSTCGYRHSCCEWSRTAASDGWPENRRSRSLIAQHTLATLYPRRPQLHLTEEASQYLQSCEFKNNVQGLMELMEVAGTVVEGDEIGIAQLSALKER